MVSYESSCVSCPTMGLPCMGVSCSNHEPFAVMVCDQCGGYAEELWEAEGKELCFSCLYDIAGKIFPVVRKCTACNEENCDECFYDFVTEYFEKIVLP